MEPEKDKRGYAPPRLTLYGRMQELTASGSAVKRENKAKPTRDARP